MHDIMIDIETLGTAPNGAIVSIGAVQFDMETGETGLWYSEAVSLKSSVNAGLTMDPETVLWWLKQDPAAVEAWRKDSHSLLNCLRALDTFFGQCRTPGPPLLVWANAPTFDLAILRTAHEKVGLAVPWHFSNERCIRTLVQLSRDFGYDPKSVPREKGNLAHDALDDCYYQIQYCVAAWNCIRRS